MQNALLNGIQENIAESIFSRTEILLRFATMVICLKKACK